MRLSILNNDSRMSWLAKLDEETFHKVLRAMPGSGYEKVEVIKQIRKKRKGRIIVHIPHASLTVPDFFTDRLTVSKDAFDRMNIYESDYLIDEFRPVDLDCLIFPYSRMFCDVERFREDYLETMAKCFRRGVVYERNADQKVFVKIDTEYKSRILNEYYNSHHKRFHELVTRKLFAYGECLIIDLHSFSDEYERKTKVPFSGWGSNPDICIGFNDYDSVKNLIADLQRLCSSYGYSNLLNYPYEGSIVPLDYMNSRNVKSIMLEVNKRIYLNEKMDALDPNKSDKLKNFFSDFYSSL